MKHLTSRRRFSAVAVATATIVGLGLGALTLRPSSGNAATAPVGCYAWSANLRAGSTGPAVTALQQALTRLGVASLTADGIFGPRTDAAVRAFQSSAGLVADGIAGPKTFAALRQRLACDATPAPVPTPAPTPGPVAPPVAGAYYTAQVPIPANWNTPGLHQAGAAVVSSYVGALRSPGSGTCQTLPAAIKAKMVTASVGPFRVTGDTYAVDALRRGLERVRTGDPALYSLLGTQGMLCYRNIKHANGTLSSSLSNHSWGVAVDITIAGATDPRANGKAMRGNAILATYLAQEGFYWGGAFSSEDSMHYELSVEGLQAGRRVGTL